MRPLRRPKHIWEDNIKMDLRKIGFGGMDFIYLSQGRDRWWTIVNLVLNLQNSIEGREFLD
jgi:ribosome biogenesis protein Nip4